jgi:secreted trypsin-like serine protease
MKSVKTIALVSVLFTALVSLEVQAQENNPATDTSDSDMIVGGEPAQSGEWPWQVRLYEGSDDAWGFCGGSLIASRWILTAAHCVPNRSKVSVGFGNIRLDKHKRLSSSGIYVHPKYDPQAQANDIALIKLSKPVDLGKGVTKISLADNAFYKASLGKQAFVTGWGQLLDEEKLNAKYPDGKVPWNLVVPKTLMEVDVKVQDLAECRANYGGADSIPVGHLCAGYKKGGKDSCQGDSGGPLVVRDANSRAGWSLLGVVSFGRGCALPKFYGAYTRVDYFRSWIKDVMEAN